ncbi:MAG: hypothetical protein K2X64_01190 [Rhodocyclaceae bacterium]|nr:hypothetical protein [Rhodocyclaceae bacterium]
MAEPQTSVQRSQPIKVDRVIVGNDGVVKLNLPKGKLKSVEIADVDLLLRFEDGTNLLLVNGALDALGDKAPIVDFQGSKVSSAELLQSAGKTSIVTAGNVRIITDELDTRSNRPSGDSSDTPSDQPNLSQQLAPPAPSKTATALTTPSPVPGRNGGEGDGANQGAAPIQPLRVDVPSTFRQGTKVVGVESVQVGIPSINPSYYTADQYKLQPSGTTAVPVGSRTATANALGDHATNQVINGTSGNDVINHNTSFSANTGIWVTTLHLDFPNFTDLTSVTLTINSAANAVAGIDFAAAQATRTSTNTWTLLLDSNTITNGIDLLVRYNIAADGTTPNTLIAMDVEAIGKAGVFNFDIIKNVYFKYQDATTAADFEQTTAAGVPIYTLPAFGVGYRINAGNGDDTVNAGAGADQVYGGVGNDTLNGNSGNDLLVGGVGADTLDGGTGTNTAGYSDATAAVTAALSTGTFNGVTFSTSGSGILNGGTSGTAGDAGGDLLTNIQNLSGSDFNDVLVGSSGVNRLSGGAGDDLLEGLAGGDTLDGGTGTNTATYEHAGAAVIASLSTGSFGSVTFTAPASGGVLNGGTSGTAGDAGGDTLINIQNLTGSAFNDILVGNANANTIIGGDGDDSLQGMAGADTLNGAIGNNTASYSAATNGVIASLTAGSFGGATFSSSGGGIRNDANATVAGDAGGDTLINIQNLTGSAFNDTLIGNSSNNVIEGGAGSDTIDGQGGVDTVTYATGSSGVITSLSTGTFSGVTFLSSGSGVLNSGSSAEAGDAAGDVLIGIRNLTGTNFADTLVGDANNNTINGGSGNDILEGMAGADTLDGGTGTNTASYSGASSGVTAALSAGTFGGVIFSTSGGGILNGGTSGTAGDAGGDLLINIQNLTGSAQADTLIGSSTANTINGGAGNDMLEGMGGGDTIDGGGGSNTVSYEHAAARVVSSLAAGTYSGVSFSASSGGILNAGNTASAGNAAGELLINIQNLRGSAFDDTLVGDANDNSLEGGAGADTLTGGGGQDTASYSISGAAVTAALTAGTYGGITFTTSGGGILNGGTVGAVADAAGDTLIGIENLTGSSFNDTLVGNAADNVLSGNDGDDTLIGLAGADTLRGGNGNDTASYADSTTGVTASLSSGVYNGIAFNAFSGGILNGGTSGSAGDAGGDLLISIENLTGSNNNDTLVGDSAANALSGGGGDDVLQGMAGGDTLDGGTGTNTASYANAGAAVVASLSTGTLGGVTFTSSGGGILNGGTSGTAGDAGGDTLINIQNLTGSGFNDTLSGNSSANVIDGGAGTDTVSYNASVAAVVASLSAGTFGGVTFTSSGGGVLNGGTSGAAGDAGGDLLISIENLTGSNNNDTLVGDSAANVLSGGGGDDVLQGMAGGDTLDGGTGTNTASYANAGAAVVASLSTGTLGGVTFTSSGGGILNGGTSGTAGDAGGDTLINIQNLTGSGFNDTLSGDTNNNLIEGGAGADFIDAGAGTDTVTYANAAAGVVASLATGTYAGANGNVTFTAGSGGIVNGGNSTTAGDAGGDTLIGVESLTGSALNDLLIGSSTVNTLTGGDGDDTLLGLGGGDTLIGGNGNNTASYAGSGAVVASLSAGTYAGAGGNVTFTVSSGGILNGGSTGTANDAAGDLLIGIQNLVGSSNNDTLVGDANDNNIQGGAGNDILQGRAGADTIDGGTGTNTASYANASTGVVTSLATGTHGGVTFTASGGGILNGGTSGTAGDAGGDLLINIQDLRGSGLNDTLIGSSGNNTIEGGAGADTIDGSGGTDTITYVNAGTRVISSLKAGTFGGITFTTVAGGVSNGGAAGTAGDAGGDVLTGIENMIGSGFNDTLVGDDSDNVLEGGAGGDTLNGQGGTDTATYANATAAVVASLSTGTYAGGSGNVTFSSSGGGILNGGSTGTAGQASADVLIQIENLTGSGFADTLIGDANANVLDGGAGNDVLQGMGGADTLNGNAGTDTASYANASGGVIASLQTGIFGGVTFSTSGGGILNTGTSGTAGDAGGDLLISIENLIGSSSNDTLVGSTAANTIEGGAGGDTIDGGGGTDTASYANSSVGVTASLSAGTYNSVVFSPSGSGILNGGTSGTAGDAGGDTLIAITNIIGSALADTLVGSAGANTLTGGLGNDTLEGLAGGDTLDGGGGTDTASYANAAAGVVASLSTGSYGGVTFTSSGGGILNGGGGAAGDAGGDNLIAIENITGSANADTLVGDSTANILLGGDGNDTLQGMAGADTLNGGIGTDLASYLNAGSGVIASLLAGTYNGVTFTSSSGGILNTGSAGTAGDAGGDLLIGMEGLVGSAFADTLVAASGASISAQGGNDTLYVSNSSLPGAVDGGAGTDTAFISGLTTGSNSMSSLSTLLSNIETLNIRADGVSSTTVFTAANIQAIVNQGTASELTILANTGDTFSFSSTAGQYFTTTSLGGGNTDYTIFNASNAQIGVVHWQAA